MLFIDTREHGKVVDDLTKALPVERMVLDGGDYLIPKKESYILIERSTFSDFLGKIKSQRLWEQIDKCKELTDDRYLLLENPYSLKYSNFNRGAIWAIIAEVSRVMKVMFAMNGYDSYTFIKHLYEKYNTERKIESHEVRVKPRNMTPQQQAMYCIMGVEGVGEATAKKLLTDRTITGLADLTIEELETIVNSNVAQKIYNVLHVVC